MNEQQSARAYALVFFGRSLFRCGLGAVVLALVALLFDWRALWFVSFGGAVAFFLSALFARVEAGTYGYGQKR
jgi:hypothetical protein